MPSEPNACGRLLLMVHVGVSDAEIRRHRKSCEECQRIIAELGPTKYDKPEERFVSAFGEAIRPIIDAAKESVEYHTSRSEAEYPGYVWIEWIDLVRFVETLGRDWRLNGRGGIGNPASPNRAGQDQIGGKSDEVPSILTAAEDVAEAARAILRPARGDAPWLHTTEFDDLRSALDVYDRSWAEARRVALEIKAEQAKLRGQASDGAE